jgi:hypothetical protein
VISSVKVLALALPGRFDFASSSSIPLFCAEAPAYISPDIDPPPIVAISNFDSSSSLW